MLYANGVLGNAGCAVLAEPVTALVTVSFLEQYCKIIAPHNSMAIADDFFMIRLILVR